MCGAGYLFVKRSFDFLLSLVSLALSAPLWILVSIVTFAEDGGPVLFLQERAGRNGKVFRIVKFRTMRVPKDGKAWLDVDLDHDPRVTRVGRILRAAAIDELPELINILKGDMSFVGPRPLPFWIEDQERSRSKSIAGIPGYIVRVRVRPGLTGIAQIYAPKDIDRRGKFRYDNLYVRNMSFWLDVRLLLLSFWVTLMGGWERRGKKI